MTIQILGSGCAKCNLLEKTTREAIAELGLSASVEKISDFGTIAAMGVMTTPALGVNGVIRSSGKVLTKDQVKALLAV
ncbi:MAG: thioredoxin family protein [Spirochaetales bacterium]